MYIYSFRFNCSFYFSSSLKSFYFCDSWNWSFNMKFFWYSDCFFKSEIIKSFRSPFNFNTVTEVGNLLEISSFWQSSQLWHYFKRSLKYSTSLSNSFIRLPYWSITILFCSLWLFTLSRIFLLRYYTEVHGLN